MKKTILSIATFVCFAMVSNAQTPEGTVAAPVDPNAPEITFESSVIDYGTIEHNAEGTRTFKFKNTGKNPLIISEAHGSCGCTVPTAPVSQMFKAGESGEIKVHYSTDRVGAFDKTVTVTSNAKNSPSLVRIKGVVKPDPAPVEAVPTGTGTTGSGTAVTPVTPVTTVTPSGGGQPVQKATLIAPKVNATAPK